MSWSIHSNLILDSKFSNRQASFQQLSGDMEDNSARQVVCCAVREREQQGSTYESYNIPPTNLTITFVAQVTFLDAPCHGRASALSARTSFAKASLRAKTSGEREGGVNMRNDNSVSRLAERELRFVDPKSVRSGAEVGVGDSQIPLEW